MFLWNGTLCLLLQYLTFQAQLSYIKQISRCLFVWAHVAFVTSGLREHTDGRTKRALNTDESWLRRVHDVHGADKNTWKPSSQWADDAIFWTLLTTTIAVATDTTARTVGPTMSTMSSLYVVLLQETGTSRRPRLWELPPMCLLHHQGDRIPHYTEQQPTRQPTQLYSLFLGVFNNIVSTVCYVAYNYKWQYDYERLTQNQRIPSPAEKPRKFSRNWGDLGFDAM
jgi:hypothetical protein